MDRPYLRGTPGNTKTITGGVKNYFPVEDIGVPNDQELDEDRNLDLLRNENRWID